MKLYTTKWDTMKHLNRLPYYDLSQLQHTKMSQEISHPGRKSLKISPSECPNRAMGHLIHSDTPYWSSFGLAEVRSLNLRKPFILRMIICALREELSSLYECIVLCHKGTSIVEAVKESV